MAMAREAQFSVDDVLVKQRQNRNRDKGEVAVMAITSPPLIPSSPANPARLASYRTSFAAQLVHKPDPSQSPSPFSPPPFPTSAAATSDLRRPRSLTRIGTAGSHRWSHPLPAIAHDGAPVWTVTPTTASAALATSAASSLAATAPLTALTPISAALTSPGSRRPLTSPMRMLPPPVEPIRGLVNVTGGVNETGGVPVMGVNAPELSMRGSISVGMRPLTSPRPSPRPPPLPSHGGTHPHPPTSPTSTISQLLNTTASRRTTHPSAAEYQKERALARERAQPPIPPSLTRAMVPEVHALYGSTEAAFSLPRPLPSATPSRRALPAHPVRALGTSAPSTPGPSTSSPRSPTAPHLSSSRSPRTPQSHKIQTVHSSARSSVDPAVDPARHFEGVDPNAALSRVRFAR